MTGALGFLGGAKALSLFSGGLGYAAVAIGAAGATYYITSRSYEVSIANLRAERADDTASRASAALAQFISDSKVVADAARTFQASQASYQQGLADINAAFKAAAAAHPLPASCKPDAARMRALADAITAANSAAGVGSKPGPAVSSPLHSRPH